MTKRNQKKKNVTNEQLKKGNKKAHITTQRKKKSFQLTTPKANVHVNHKHTDKDCKRHNSHHSKKNNLYTHIAELDSRKSSQRTGHTC